MSDQATGSSAPSETVQATAPPAGATTTAPPAPGPAADGAGDWTVTVTDRVESVVGTIRDKTTVPITKVSRIVVFGLIVAVGGITALLLVIVAALRIADAYLPFAPLGRRVWVSYVALGAIFLLAGAFCWSKRSPRSPQEAS